MCFDCLRCWKKGPPVKALKKARKLIETAPDTTEARTLSALVVALESEGCYAIGELYKLDYDHFDLAMDLLREWRLDRYYMSKVRLLDLSVQVTDMTAQATSATPAASTAAAT